MPDYGNINEPGARVQFPKQPITQQKAPAAGTAEAQMKETMTTNTKPSGQVKRLVLEIDGVRYSLDASITKEEALSVLDIISKGMRRTDYVHSPACYGRADYVGPEAEISLRVHSGPVYESRAEAQAAADAAEAAEKGGAK